MPRWGDLTILRGPTNQSCGSDEQWEVLLIPPQGTWKLLPRDHQGGVFCLGFLFQFQSWVHLLFSVCSSSHSLEPMPQFEGDNSIVCFSLHLQIYQGWPPTEVLQEEGTLWTSVPASLYRMLFQKHQGRELIRYWSMQLQTVLIYFVFHELARWSVRREDVL